MFLVITKMTRPEDPLWSQTNLYVDKKKVHKYFIRNSSAVNSGTMSGEYNPLGL